MFVLLMGDKSVRNFPYFKAKTIDTESGRYKEQRPNCVESLHTLFHFQVGNAEEAERFKNIYFGDNLSSRIMTTSIKEQRRRVYGLMWQVYCLIVCLSLPRCVWRLLSRVHVFSLPSMKRWDCRAETNATCRPRSLKADSIKLCQRTKVFPWQRSASLKKVSMNWAVESRVYFRFVMAMGLEIVYF